jgi:mRNA interferase RelE/StbE
LTWSVEFDDAAAKELRKLDRQVQQEILRYFRERIATNDDPRRFGKPLSRDLTGLWRYRVRDYKHQSGGQDEADGEQRTDGRSVSVGEFAKDGHGAKRRA